MRRKNGLPGRISATARWIRSVGLASPYYGGSGVCWDARASYQELRDSIGHVQPRTFHPREGMSRHLGKLRRIITWRSTYAVPKMGRLLRETVNHQYKRSTELTSWKKGHH